MDNLSTASNDISNQIGALELGGYLESHSDGVLETAGMNAFGPTVDTGTCPPYCRRIGDGALEAAGVSTGPHPPVTAYCAFTRIACISDATLEAAGANLVLGPPTSNSTGCYPNPYPTFGCR
jgi:hypothetical protein